MADFMRQVIAQRQMAQRAAQADQMRALQMRRMQELEAHRAQQYQQQQAVQQRFLDQDSFRNTLDLERFKQEQARDTSMAAERRNAALARDRQAAATALAANRGTLRPGHRWKQSNPLEQELIMDSQEAQKMRAQHSGDVNKLQSVNNSTRELVKTIDYILDPKNKSGFEANFGGWNAYLTRLLPDVIPGFARTGDVSTAVERLTELAETSGLGGIRGGSGQSVGAITEREWPKFAAQLLKTSPRLNEDTARQVLKDARATAMDLRNRELGAYENEWKPTPFYTQDPFRTPVGPNLGQQPAAPVPAATPVESQGQWQVIR